ncbi:tRNA (mnm(5)s(2)U34)-methyltransferase [Staphylococcus lutrae]|uniref:16S rRNA (Cytosine(1402)-N(4))-methyltransferase n=1 Tax=Staphylococcus lutrae TaxID=155085 RepID=A0AAC9RUI1_9STAP|nr:class I SAM-dependent methyltransferase [Staphylococcus lutrae]ARJ50047.1 16S rRNA (cytosine(1402)-N(4))-methyltransferase [Staphylococcus lutrae]PNZ37078.1 methyltransferase domain-containing protein [Staphylococcus lutrae]
MIVSRILPFAKSLIRSHVAADSVVIDATCGNGHDTLFLAKLVPHGHVYGCDIQADAISHTQEKVQSFDHVTLFQVGHEDIIAHIPESHRNQIHAAIFNLGYLPKGNKRIVTHASTTITAIERIFEVLQPEGIIVLVVYPGHEEGAIESRALIDYLSTFDQQLGHVIKYEFINQQNQPPYVVAIEKRA